MALQVVAGVHGSISTLIPTYFALQSKVDRRGDLAKMGKALFSLFRKRIFFFDVLGGGSFAIFFEGENSS